MFVLLFLDKYLLEGHFCNGTYFEYLSQIFCIEKLIWDGGEVILTSCVVVVTSCVSVADCCPIKYLNLYDSKQKYP